MKSLVGGSCHPTRIQHQGSIKRMPFRSFIGLAMLAEILGNRGVIGLRLYIPGAVSKNEVDPLSYSPLYENDWIEGEECLFPLHQLPCRMRAIADAQCAG